MKQNVCFEPLNSFFDKPNVGNISRCLTRRCCQVFAITIFPARTNLALSLCVESLNIAVRSAGTCLPVKPGTGWTVVTERAYLRLTGLHAVVTRWARLAHHGMGVVHLHPNITQSLYVHQVLCTCTPGTMYMYTRYYVHVHCVYYLHVHCVYYVYVHQVLCTCALCVLCTLCRPTLHNVRILYALSVIYTLYYVCKLGGTLHSTTGSYLVYSAVM